MIDYNKIKYENFFKFKSDDIYSYLLSIDDVKALFDGGNLYVKILARSKDNYILGVNKSEKYSKERQDLYRTNLHRKYKYHIYISRGRFIIFHMGSGSSFDTGLCSLLNYMMAQRNGVVDFRDFVDNYISTLIDLDYDIVVILNLIGLIGLDILRVTSSDIFIGYNYKYFIRLKYNKLKKSYYVDNEKYIRISTGYVQCNKDVGEYSLRFKLYSIKSDKKIVIIYSDLLTGILELREYDIMSYNLVKSDYIVKCLIGNSMSVQLCIKDITKDTFELIILESDYKFNHRLSRIGNIM